MKFFKNLLDVNHREVESLKKTIQKVSSFEPAIKKLKDADIAKKTQDFKKQLANGTKLHDLLPEAFALVREASGRALGLSHYDVQLIAAAALFTGKVSEQKTGEGKTLSAVPALYLRALTGKGAHLVTVNDYLARRDAGWNGPTFHLLGMTVAVIAGEQKSYIFDPKFRDDSHGDERLAHLKPCTRAEAYAADITYGTNNEFGFDYLRDNMVSSKTEMVQRGHYFAIVDEVDSVLIDEARTPLIISAPDSEPTDKYYTFAKMIDKLNGDTDFTIDEKSKSASLTEHGIQKVEKILGIDNLYEKDFEAIHHIENALRARSLYLQDREYVVRENEVIIVDEFTGRLMPGRRWSDGLHQAVEAKEGVKVQQESKTLATISFQNYFRMYEALSGMTGTAATEASEFKKIYNLDVVVIPTHRANVRIDAGDVIYKTVNAKYTALADEVIERNKKGQPVLIGTTSIEKNEIISQILTRKKITHQVLNAKNHESEAMILAEAGKPGAVTVATNMAGRGVDIILGGTPPQRPEGTDDTKWKKTKAYVSWKEAHEKVVAAGGLHVIGTERHESRRIDNQLRGRAGRQGDPGSTLFYLSLEDDLMRIFGGEQIKNIMDKLRLPEDQPIQNGLVTRSIEQAQVKVEGFHFDQRKRLVEYDDVANQQREIVYKLRGRILSGENVKEEITRKLNEQVDYMMLSSWATDEPLPDYEKLGVSLSHIIPFDDASRVRVEKEMEKVHDREQLSVFLKKIIADTYASREDSVSSTSMREIEKYAYLGAIDHLWIDHIDHIDGLREGVMLRAYGQRDPLVEFKAEAYDLFERLLEKIDQELSTRIFRISLTSNQVSEIPLSTAITNVDHSDNIGLVDDATAKLATTGHKMKSTTHKKMGRNDVCWCGSGKKWKKCHYPKLPPQ
jgi:preprotein translocase subunit SecA